MALLNGPVAEEQVSGERFAMLQRDYTRLERAAAILENAVLAVIDSKDGVVKEGTRATMCRVVELCEWAWLESEAAMRATEDELAKVDEPYCTNCQTHLSESSLHAGYCLKCTYASTQQ